MAVIFKVRLEIGREAGRADRWERLAAKRLGNAGYAG